MVQLSILATAIAVGLYAKSIAAHPGEHHDHMKIRRELEDRYAYSSHIERSLEKCARSPEALEMEARAIKRRALMTEKLRKKAGITVRKPSKKSKKSKKSLSDLQTWEKTSHNATGQYSAPYSETTLFGSNVSCVLTPEDVVGPYYVLGELIRSNVVETQKGVPVHLEMQFVDISSCKPITSSLLVDLWHANATGVYSGVSAAGEGGLNTDFLRGVQQTDSDGVVAFDTIFPGHYQGRATHMHVTTHKDSTVRANQTYTGGTVTHIGQLFFDEKLRSAVEALSPYSGNKQSVTSNDNDMWAPSAASAKYDPFPRYLYLGNSLSDGLIMWISIGVDMTANYTSDATPAAYWGANGGYDSGQNQGGPPGGGPPGGASSTTSKKSSTTSSTTTKKTTTTTTAKTTAKTTTTSRR